VEEEKRSRTKTGRERERVTMMAFPEIKRNSKRSRWAENKQNRPRKIQTMETIHIQDITYI
jgi:hypothetical protein